MKKLLLISLLFASCLFVKAQFSYQPTYSLLGTVSSSSSSTLWVDHNGNDSSAQRGRQDKPFGTIAAAKAVAQDGDTMVINPGVWNENNILKKGVNYSCTGVTFTMAPATSVTDSYLGIFDDRPTGATTNYIYGKPNIIYHTGTNGPDLQVQAEATCTPAGGAIGALGVSLGPIVITNAATRFYGDIGNIQFGSLDNLNNIAAVVVLNCGYVSLNIGEITDLFGSTFGAFPTTNQCSGIPGVPLTAQTFGTGIFWRLGDMHVNFGHIGVMPNYGIWPEQTGTNAANLYCTGDLLEQKIYQVGNNQNYVTWFDIKEIRGNEHLTTATCFDIFGGKAYLYAEKVWGTNVSANCVNCRDGGNVWVYCSKFEASGTGSFVTMNNASGGTVYLNVQHYADSGTLSTGIGTISANCNLFINGGRMVMANGVGINNNAGTVHLNGLTIDTSTGTGTNKWPLLIGANNLYMQNCTLIAPANTESIHAASAFNVGLLGGTAANSSKSANVTFSPNAGTFSVDTLVR